MGRYARWGDARIRIIGSPVLVVRIGNIITEALRENDFDTDRFSDLYPLKGNKNQVRVYTQTREHKKHTKKDNRKEHA